MSSATLTAGASLAGTGKRKQWDEAQAERLVRAVVYRREWQFREFPDHDADYLTDECLSNARQAFRRLYKPQRSTPSTFITSCTDLHLRFMLRTARRRQHRETVAAFVRRDAAALAAPPEPDEPADLVRWASEAFRLAANRLVSYGVGSSFGKRDVIDRPQLSVLLALKKRLGLATVPELVAYLAAHPELLKSIRLDRVPTCTDLFECRRKLLTLDFT